MDNSKRIIVSLALFLGLCVLQAEAVWMLNISSLASHNHFDDTKDLLKKDHGLRIDGSETEAKNLVDLAESLGLSVLVKALEETGLDNVIDHEGQFTLFAPTNEAFNRIPEWAKNIPLKEVLRFHVARGLFYDKDLKNDHLLRTLHSKRDIRINLYKDGQVITACGKRINGSNYEAHNGVLHILDDVIVSIPERQGTIIDQLRRCPVFSDLVELIDKAGLVEALKQFGPYTMFAPSNDVIRKLPADVINHLVNDPALLKQVLTYHVVAGSFYSIGIEDGAQAKTLQGNTVVFHVQDGKVTVNDKATVTSADGNASNGVIHSVDSVLIPPQVEAKLKHRALTKTRLSRMKPVIGV